MTDLITRDLVRLDASLGADKEEVIRALARVVADAGRSTTPDQLAADAITREGTAATGLPAGLAFLIAAPAGGDATHLQLLTKLARALVKKDFTDGLRAASTPDEVVALVQEVVGDGPATTTAPAATTA